MAVKLENCPMCDKVPDSLSVGGLHIICCMPCTNVIGPNGQAGSTVTESKKNWNTFAVVMRKKLSKQSKPHQPELR